MAYGKTASCLIAISMALGAAQFPVRHAHLHGYCEGVLTVDEHGVTFVGPKEHKWTWSLVDIQQLRIASEGVTVLSYVRDRRFVFAGRVPAEELIAALREPLGQKLVAAIAEPELGAWSLPVRQLKPESQGVLAFGDGTIVYSTLTPGDSRTWRWTDIDSISSSGAYELSLTTLERTFHFQLKSPLAESKYDELWMMLQKKTAKLQ